MEGWKNERIRTILNKSLIWFLRSILWSSLFPHKVPQYSILVDSSDDEEVEEIEDEFEDDLKYLRSLDPKVSFKN